MDANDMTTIADMLRTIVKTEMDGHFVRDGETQPTSTKTVDEPDRDGDEWADLFGARRPYPPENVWLYAAIRRGDIQSPGGPEGNWFKLWVMLRHAGETSAHYYGAWLSGELDERHTSGTLTGDEEGFLVMLRGEYDTYKTYVNRYRRTRGL